VAEGLEAENLQLFQFEQLPLLRHPILREKRGTALYAPTDARCSVVRGGESSARALPFGCLLAIPANTNLPPSEPRHGLQRSEERRVGKEGKSRGAAEAWRGERWM